MQCPFVICYYSRAKFPFGGAGVVYFDVIFHKKVVIYHKNGENYTKIERNFARKRGKFRQNRGKLHQNIPPLSLQEGSIDFSNILYIYSS
jgi:hypothetical protein